MEIVNFNHSHIPAAQAIALAAYQNACEAVPALPMFERTPELTLFADNGMSVAALENGRLIGFICAYPPYDNAFGTTGLTGVYVPAFAHGAVGETCARVYARLYEAVAARWVKAGAISHCITLYAHEKDAVNQFFRYGFGLRCVDAVRSLDLLPFKPMEGCYYSELTKDEAMDLYPLFKAINQHFTQSPVFMRYQEEATEALFAAKIEEQNARYFTVSQAGQYVAYMKISQQAEHFATLDDRMASITGAYCLPSCRGGGLYASLLAYVNNRLKDEGYSCLGVDYESFNPTANSFWRKWFTPYTASLARVIDGFIVTL